MQFTETADGVAYTEGNTSIVFPFGATPYLAQWGVNGRIEHPERFGPYETAAQRREFVRRFHEGLDKNYGDWDYKVGGRR